MCGNRAVINIKPKADYNLPLIFFFLKSKYDELVDMAVGSAQMNLYVPILATMKISLPDKKHLTHFYLAANSLIELMKLKTLYYLTSPMKILCFAKSEAPLAILNRYLTLKRCVN